MRKTPEADIQEAVVQHLLRRAPKDCYWFHPPNGGYRHPREAAKFKRLGVRLGVPDIIALHAGQFHALELKGPGGRASEAQLIALDEINAAGGFACQVEGLDRALAVLTSWGILK